MQWETDGSFETGHALTDCHPPGLRDARMEEATLKKEKTKGDRHRKPPPLPRRERAWDLGGGNRDGEGQTALKADEAESETGMKTQ